MNLRCKQPFMVMELLSYSLFDVLKNRNFEGFSLNRIRRIGIQLFDALEFLKTLKIIHTDLKPENIVLTNSFTDDVKIIDFGQAVLINQFRQPIQTILYRAPEIFLDFKADYSIDMWSIGCVLAELFTGSVLFHGGCMSAVKQFHAIVSYLGYPPKHLLDTSSQTKLYFTKLPNGTWCLPSLVNNFHSNYQFKMVCSQAFRNYFEESRTSSTDSLEFLDFFNLLDKIIVYEDSKRLTPLEAMNHKFFKTTTMSQYDYNETSQEKKSKKRPKVIFKLSNSS